MSISQYHNLSSQEDQLHSLTSDFFYDEKVILSFDSSSVEQAKGHLVLLGSNVESFLKLATLIDGSSIDFLFGVRITNQITGTGRSKANEVKKFIRSLDSASQEASAEFYFSLYNAIVDYYNAQKQCCSFLCQERDKQICLDKIERAFNTLSRKIKSQSKQ